MTGLGARMERDESVQGLSNGNWGELSFPCCLSDIVIFLVTSDHHYFMLLYLLSYLFSPGLHLSLFSVLFHLASPFRNQPRGPDFLMSSHGSHSISITTSTAPPSFFAWCSDDSSQNHTSWFISVRLTWIYVRTGRLYLWSERIAVCTRCSFCR